MSLEEIFTFENIYAAHKWCRKSKQHKGEVVRFEIDLSKNITELIKELTSISSYVFPIFSLPC